MNDLFSLQQQINHKVFGTKNMNRTEAKVYVLDVLGLDRDHVRQFGNLSRTQTWLDAIAAFEAASELTETEDISLEAVTEASATISLPEEPTPENSFITFWEAEPDPVVPQPLACLPELDEAWDEPATPAPVVYPIVILLMMLWAFVQVLLLGCKALCWGLAEVGQWLDSLAQARLERQRAVSVETASGLVLALS